MSQEIALLRQSANDLAEQGDIVAALILDDIACLLERGHVWEQLLDDVAIRAPYVN